MNLNWPMNCSSASMDMGTPRRPLTLWRKRVLRRGGIDSGGLETGLRTHPPLVVAAKMTFPKLGASCSVPFCGSLSPRP